MLRSTETRFTCSVVVDNISKQNLSFQSRSVGGQSAIWQLLPNERLFSINRIINMYILGCPNCTDLGNKENGLILKFRSS